VSPLEGVGLVVAVWFGGVLAAFGLWALIVFGGDWLRNRRRARRTIETPWGKERL
jgi:hypothetical protein